MPYAEGSLIFVSAIALSASKIGAWLA